AAMSCARSPRARVRPRPARGRSPPARKRPTRPTRSARRAIRKAITSKPITGSTGTRSEEAAMLIKRQDRETRRNGLAAALAAQSGGALARRGFLRRSGLAAGGLAPLGALPLSSVRKAEAGPPPQAGAPVEVRKSICTHCSVGCTVTAEVQNGVWIGQEPSWDSPFNRGSHCAKGASVRELVHSDRKLKYPLKLVNGQWTRVSWDTAIGEIGDKLTAIREKSGADSV